MIRLRQVVMVARELEPVVEDLRDIFGLGSPYRDPGVGEFGLENAVLPVGDTFLEVVSPREERTTASRYLERRGGDGGYMVIIQVDDMEATRAHLHELGVRVVWKADHADIRGTHLHPKDVGGAILSLDQAIPPESWRWAGPDWQSRVATSVVREVTAVEIQAADPVEMSRRWAEVLDRPVLEWDGAQIIELHHGGLRFLPPRDDRGDGISGFDLGVADRERLEAAARERGFEIAHNRITLGGTRFYLK